MPTRRPRFKATALSASLLASLFFATIVGAGGAARGADPDASGPGGDSSAPAPAEWSPSGPPNAPAEPATDSSGLVQRLPGSAYPGGATRGLYGGSLWADFHGLQWPYFPRNGIGISGWGWLDTGYESLKIPVPTQVTTKSWSQAGRLVVRATPTYSSNGWFVQSQVELVANKDQSQGQPSVVDTDDLWIRTGYWKSWDITVGRFLAWEVYHLGMGLDLNTQERLGAFGPNVPQLYALTFLWDRPKGPGNVAFHYYFRDFLRVELLGQIGAALGGQNLFGARPALVFDIGWLKIKGGAEFSETQDPTGSRQKATQQGFGGSAALIFLPYVEGGLNFAHAQVDLIDSGGLVNVPGSNDQNSYGGFLNVRAPGIEDLLAGFGANRVVLTNRRNDVASHLQTFVSLQYLIGRQLFVRAVASYAKADITQSFTATPPYQNTMYSGRIRLTYLF